MAKGRYSYEDGGTVIHVFFKGSAKPREVEVPIKRAVWIDPSAGRYQMIDGKMRRIFRPKINMPQVIVRRQAA